MNIAALIVAAGRGERLGGDIPKQYRQLAGRPALAWSIQAFADAGIGQILVAIDQNHDELCRIATKGGPPIRIVSGGATRTASVRAGLAAIDGADIIHIHDAARPGLTTDIIAALEEAVRAGADGAAPGLAVADSLRRIDAVNTIVGEVEREGLIRVQTPQTFRAPILREAYAALGDDAVVSDDLAVVRARGGRCVIIPGDPRLMKLTYPEDFAQLERMMSERVTCVGNGVDAHRFGPGEFVTLCGVRIPHDKGLVGHSDADAGWHALVDAILGALGQGDIGAHFPPSDPQWKGADSERFLRHAAQLADAAGARILHVDVTLICERPKVGPHRDRMRQRTAEVLGLRIERVSVKATTTERMGFLGREEGLAAQATATLDRPV